MSKRINDWKTDVVRTTDASPTVAAKAALHIPDGTSGHVHIHVNARHAEGMGASAIVTRAFHVIGGALSLVGRLQAHFGEAGALHGDPSLDGARIDVVAANGEVQPHVTGLRGVDIEWYVDARYTLN